VNQRIDPDFTMGDVWADLAKRYGLDGREAAGEEVVTTREFAAMYGISRDKALSIIHKEYKEGRVEVTEKRVTCIGGNRQTTVMAYRLLSEEEANEEN
jgi:hypothetical protein